MKPIIILNCILVFTASAQLPAGSPPLPYSVTTINGVSTTNTLQVSEEVPFGYAEPDDNQGTAPAGKLVRKPVPVTVTVELYDKLSDKPHTTIVRETTNDTQFVKWTIVTNEVAR